MQPNQEKKAERGKLWEELGPEKYAKDCLGIGPSQYKKYRRAFSLMDAGGEGTISKKEFIFMLDKFQLGTALSKTEVNDLFDRLDKGGSLDGELSGEIDFKEFLDNLDRKNLDKSLAGIIPALLSKEELIEKEVKKIRKTLKSKKSDDKSPSGDKTPKEVVVKVSQKIIEEIEFSREDYKKNKKVFKAIDKEAKGSFDREDFGKALKVYFIWQNTSEEYIDEVYNKLYKTEAGTVDLLCFLRSLKNQDNREFILWVNVLVYLLENANQGVDAEKLIKESNSLFLIEIEELREIISQKDAELEESRRKEEQHLQEIEESRKIIQVLRTGSFAHTEDAEYEKLSFQEKINLFSKDFSKKSETIQTEERVKRSAAPRKDSSSSSGSDKNDKEDKEDKEVDALKLRIQELENQLAESREEFTTVQTQKSEIEVIHDDLIQSVANLRLQLTEKNQEILNLQSNSSTETQELHNACQEQIVKLNEIIESLKEQLARTISKEEFEAVKQSEESFTQIVATLRSEIQSLQAEKTIIEGRESELNLLIEDLRRQIAEKKETRRKGSNDSASSKSSKSSKSEDDLKGEIEKLQVKIRDLESRGDSEESRRLIEALRQEIHTLKIELETTLKIKSELEIEKSHLLIQITTLQSQLSVKIEEFSRSSVSSKYTSFEEYYQMYMSTVHGVQDYNCTATCYCNEH